MYAKHIDRIIWIKPKWSNQIPTATYNLTIGKEKTSGSIKCNCTLSYFISDNLYAHESQLTNKHEFILQVNLNHILIFGLNSLKSFKLNIII